MKLSELNIKKINLKEVDKTYPAQDIMFKLGELYQFESGIYGYGNILTKLERSVEEVIIDELDKIGAIQVKYPILQPKNIWVQSKRWNNYTNETDTMYTIDNNLGVYGLAPTAEECATIFGANRVITEKNLPSMYYQINEKFRKEIRTRGYLFRTRAFKMLDLYSFDKDMESLRQTYEKVKEAYIKIFKRIGIEVIPIAADNGSFGGTKSEEWMAISKVGEDTCLYDGVIGLNSEILEKENYLHYLKKEYGIDNIDNMKEYRTMELGHTFQLGTKYSDTMDLKYLDSKNQYLPYYMGCYGMGIERIYTTILENSILKDEEDNILGLSLPINIAPYKVQIVYIEDKKEQGFKLYNELLNNGIKAIIDDRKDYSLGNRIKDVYVLGTPYAVIIGKNSNDDKYEVENTKTKEKSFLTITELVELLKVKL